MIRAFVESLLPQLGELSPAELYLLFQQNGLYDTWGRSRGFVRALATGRFPPSELEKFARGGSSLVDDFLRDPATSLEDILEAEPVGEWIGAVEDSPQYALPVVEATAALSAVDRLMSSADEEAAEFLIASALAKLWRHIFLDEAAAIAQVEAVRGGPYADHVRTRFLLEYQQSKDLTIPHGYAFRIDGEIVEPNLMQRLMAIRVRDSKRVGNWSGTGAGKTLAAVLASRVIDARLTVICCPNSTVDGWRREILSVYPDSIVATKTFEPEWEPRIEVWHDARSSGRLPMHRYLILNYEMFQQPDSSRRIQSLVQHEVIDFVVVDEIHFAKQREVENLSRRRRSIGALIAWAADRNPDLHVLGMSATPVINNLHEGRSLVELVTGTQHDDLQTLATVPNCMRLHQRLVTLGVRWLPSYELGFEQIEVHVDCGEYMDAIRSLGDKGSPLALEQILTRARLPAIREYVRPKTLIYTHNVGKIDRVLRDALINDGWRVGFFTGDDKSGLEDFLYGDLDVLIGSSAVATGIDGLQHVCNRVIVNVLPWTAAEFEQLKGRIYRQGQRQNSVTMVLPLTYADVGGERWSWCESKMERLNFKRSIADAAVDGVVPEGHLRTPAQAYQDVLAWLARLDGGDARSIGRPKIVVPLPDSDGDAVDRRHRRYGDFAVMNRTWNRNRSDVTHARLQENPEEWAHYHTLYQQARESWTIVPYEELIRWCQRRSGYVIGDFGCGEAKLAAALRDRHVVHSFDHVAINDDVVACDMAHVPLDDESLDVAVFSLSLMGSNATDYIREAYRTLKLDGWLHIFEPTMRFGSPESFIGTLRALGFAMVGEVESRGQFTHIQMAKTDHRPLPDAELIF